MPLTDPTPGLGCLNNRHYDPSTGVFTSVDPLVVKTGEPYVYGSANPVTFSDPSGLETCDIETGICWDDYEDFTRGSVYAKTRGAYKAAGVRPKVTYDPGSLTTVYENIPASLQGTLTEKSGVAWNSGAANGAGGYEFFNGIKNHNSGDGLELLPKFVHEYLEKCPVGCVLATGATAAVFASLTAVACPAGTIASAGLGAALACGGLGALGAAATASVYEATKAEAEGPASGRTIICKMILGGFFPPGSNIPGSVRTSAGAGSRGSLC